jgi:hypothetical protein
MRTRRKASTEHRRLPVILGQRTMQMVSLTSVVQRQHRFVSRVIPPYCFIPYATSMFDVFYRVIRPNSSTGTGEPRCRLPSEMEERRFQKKRYPLLVESNRNNRIECSAPKRHMAESRGQGHLPAVSSLLFAVADPGAVSSDTAYHRSKRTGYTKGDQEPSDGRSG